MTDHNHDEGDDDHQHHGEDDHQHHEDDDHQHHEDDDHQHHEDDDHHHHGEDDHQHHGEDDHQHHGDDDHHHHGEDDHHHNGEDDHHHNGEDDHHHNWDDDHHYNGDDDHHEDDASTVAVAILTISTSRTLESDTAGDAIAEALEDGGHEVVERNLVTDREEAIRSRLREFASNEAVGAVVTTGGTGLAPTDVTPEAVRPLFDREMPGFGEVFRTQSVAEAGPHAMLTRATAGIHGDLPIFCLPGSESAARFGTSELVVPVLGHVVGLQNG